MLLVCQCDGFLKETKGKEERNNEEEEEWHQNE